MWLVFVLQDTTTILGECLSVGAATVYFTSRLAKVQEWNEFCGGLK